MTGTVPVLSIAFMLVSCIGGFCIPILLFMYFKRKMDADTLPFFVGAGVMLLFALILESWVHQLVLGSPAGAKILDSPWLYGIYGGLMAGLFEETGRLLAFKTILRKYNEKDANALMYGAGHGGLEVIYLLVFSMITNIMFASMINSGSFAAIAENLSPEDMAQMQAVVDQMTTSSPFLFLVGLLERIFAVMLHLALSVLVWFAAKDKKQWVLFPAAILCHFAVDAAAVILSMKELPVMAIEAVVCVMTALVVLYAKKIWTANGN